MTPPDPVLFLDIDDVLCLSRPYGGYAVIDAVNGRHAEPDRVYAEVFTAQATASLRAVDALFGGRLRYVVSSTWRLHFDRAQMRAIFHKTGLGFVAEQLEDGTRWRTPLLGGGDRAGEIAHWLEHHHRGEAYAVVDDEFSGWSLLEAIEQGVPWFDGRVVLCGESVGLLDDHVPLLANLLRRPFVTRPARQEPPHG